MYLERGYERFMIFIFGASKNGHNIKRILEKSTDVCVDFYVDNNKKKQGLIMDGLKILSMDDMISKIEESYEESKVLVALLKPESVVNQIRESRLAIKVFVLSGQYRLTPSLDSMMFHDAMCEIDYTLYRLDYLEVHVAHHCNLKCKGCGHMSNLVPEEFPSIEQFVKDLHQLKKYVWGIRRFRLLGGEPLLNPELPEYIIATREVYPDADIVVVTNGLLIPYIKDIVLTTMRNNFVSFDVSCYPPTAEMKERIECRCVEYDVQYGIGHEIDKFFRGLPVTEEKDPYIAFDTCGSKKCHFMLDGKISLCGVPILRDKFYKYSEKKTVCSEAIIDLYDDNLTSEKLHYLMTHPNRQCGFCSDEKEWFEWEGYSS